MTFTWREELTLRIERWKESDRRDKEELIEILSMVQAKVLEEDRELRQLRAAKREKAKAPGPKPAPDQVPIEEVQDLAPDPDLEAHDPDKGGH